MGALESFTERMRFFIYDHFVIDGGDSGAPNAVVSPMEYAVARRPIHFGGLNIALSNSSPTVTSTITVDDSDNSVNWTPVLFSIDTTSGLLNYTMVALSQVAILFESSRRYWRISTSPYNPDGVLAVAHQWIPRAVHSEVSY